MGLGAERRHPVLRIRRRRSVYFRGTPPPNKHRTSGMRKFALSLSSLFTAKSGAVFCGETPWDQYTSEHVFNRTQGLVTFLRWNYCGIYKCKSSSPTYQESKLNVLLIAANVRDSLHPEGTLNVKNTCVNEHAQGIVVTIENTYILPLKHPFISAHDHSIWTRAPTK